MKARNLLASATILLTSIAPCGAQQPTQAAPCVYEITVNVFGEVNRINRFTLPDTSGLLDAIAAAGGLTQKADLTNITVLRKSTADTANPVLKFDMRKIFSGAAKDITLQNGDTIIANQRSITF